MRARANTEYARETVRIMMLPGAIFFAALSPKHNWKLKEKEKSVAS